MMDSNMKNASVKYIRAVKETDAYKKYYYHLEILKNNPELFKQVNEYRRRNYEIQNTTQVDELFDKMDAFEKEYEQFCENPLVDEFLRAELAFCRMMQESTIYITEELDFQ